MFKFIVFIAIIALLVFALAGPAFTAGKKISKGIDDISKDLDNEKEE